MAFNNLPRKKTKIVCTIGPASNHQATLEAMMAAGMNIARINFAHGDFDSHRKSIATVRAAAEACGKNITIMGDLPGPKMRIGKLEEEPIILVRGDSFDLYADEILGNKERAFINLPKLLEVVRPGDRIYINDGMVQLTVNEVTGNKVRTEVRAGGELRSHKGVNFPGIDLGISAFTKQDRKFLEFAAQEKLDAVSQSFVQDERDIQAVRNAAQSMDYLPAIIAKLERASAVDNLEKHTRLRGRDHGGARRSGRRGAPRRDGHHPEEDDLPGQPSWQAGDHCHAYAGIHDHTSTSNEGRGQRRGQRHPRRHRLRHAFRRNGCR